MIIIDLEHRMTIAYMLNVMEPVSGFQSEALVRAACSAMAAY